MKKKLFILLAVLLIGEGLVFGVLACTKNVRAEDRDICTQAEIYRRQQVSKGLVELQDGYCVDPSNELVYIQKEGYKIPVSDENNTIKTVDEVLGREKYNKMLYDAVYQSEFSPIGFICLCVGLAIFFCVFILSIIHFIDYRHEKLDAKELLFYEETDDD